MAQAATPPEGGSPLPAAAPADRAPPPEPAPPKPAAPQTQVPQPPPPQTPPGSSGPSGPSGPDGPAIQVEDDLQPRVRMPADLLRCILTGLELVAVAGISLLGVQVT